MQPNTSTGTRWLLYAGLSGLFLLYSCRMYFHTTTDTFTTHTASNSFGRGKNLVFTICAGCHYDPAAKKFIGRSLNDLPNIAGHLYSANLTHSVAYGMPSRYSDAELFYLLKTGISKSGKFMPYMMKPMMADKDVNDIIVYLRSNDAAVSAADTTVGKTRINVIGRIGVRLLAHPQPYNKGIASPDEKDPVLYGRYLIGIIGCYHCHSTKALGLDFLEPEKSRGYLQGGIKLKDPKGHRIYGSNLTPDKQTGIGNFSEADFQQAVREGIAPSGRKLSPPMDKFEALSEKQVHAIYAYLQSLTPVHHPVKTRT